MNTLKCICCGKEFETYNKNRKYCSVECKNKAMIKPRTTKVCLQCGKEYEVVPSDPRNFCDRKCFEEYKSKCIKLSVKICPVCGKTFETYHHDSIYCSRECSAISQQKRRIVKCETCGKEFERWEFEFKTEKRHFCSRNCKDKALRWNLDDIDILRKNYKKIPLEAIRLLLSKEYSVGAIKGKCTALGLGESRLWTDDEIKVVKDYYEIKPFNEIMKMLPKRTAPSILNQARKLGLMSYFYLNNVYTDEEISFLKENYLKMTNKELGKALSREPNGVAQKLRNLELFRPYEKSTYTYKNLKDYIRKQLVHWVNDVKRMNNYTCCLTGRRDNIVVHHCRGFTVLFDELVDMYNIPLYDNINEYSDEQLADIVDKFIDLQEYYHSYVCITSDIHRKFHGLYGYGDNTEDQWNEFVENYKLQNIA